MIKWFKKHFIPHDGNDHQPHFLRTQNIQLLILVVFVIQLGIWVLPFISQLSPANNFMASVLPAVLDDLTNQNRRDAHLAVLTISPELNRIAELKAQDMANKRYFAHVSPQGKTPWYWFDKVGYKYEYAGENLAVDFTDSIDVAIAWMNSPTHKANIIKNAYTEIGTGVATGTYQGNPTVFVAQVFAKPATVDVKETSVVVRSEKVAKEASSSKVLGASVSSIAKVATVTHAEKLRGASSTASSSSTHATSTSSSSSSVISSVIPVETSLSLEIIPLDSTPAKPYVKSGIFEKFASSPRRVLNFILAILGLLVILAIGFKLFIQMDKRHPILITRGLIVLSLICIVYVVNNHVSENKMDANTTFMSFDSLDNK